MEGECLIPSIITNKYFKFILVTILVILIAVILGENIVFIIDFPNLVFLFAGTVLLTLIGYKKGTPKEKIFDNIKRNCIITGFVGFFTGFLMALCTTEGLENLPVNIAISMLIIPYTFFLYLAINACKSKITGFTPNFAKNAKNSDTETQTNWDNIYNQYCLTEREKLFKVTDKAPVSI